MRRAKIVCTLGPSVNTPVKIRALVDAGAKVTVYDPEAMDNVRNQIGNMVAYAHTAYAALDDADALFIVTEWPLFRTPDFDKMNLLMKGKVIFDGRNVYETEQMRDMGYTYYSVGRETILSEQLSVNSKQ